MNDFILKFARYCAAAILATGALGASAQAQAQHYPNRPIKLVVPYAPGGGVDILGRKLGDAASRVLGAPVIIDNRGGAGGILGSVFVSRAEADGYTLLITGAATHGISTAVNPKLPYDPLKDFTPVILLTTTPYLVVVNPALPIHNMAELIAYARANPGKLNYATTGKAGMSQLAAEMLKVEARIDAVEVPYQGAAPGMADLVAGRVDFMFDTFATSKPFIESGRVRLVGVTTVEPPPFLPASVPVARQVPGFDVSTYFGIFAPPGLPAPVVERLNRAFNAVLVDPEVKSYLASIGMVPVGGTPQFLNQRVGDEVRRWSDLVKRAKLRFD